MGGSEYFDVKGREQLFDPTGRHLRCGAFTMLADSEASTHSIIGRALLPDVQQLTAGQLSRTASTHTWLFTTAVQQ